MSWFGSSQPPSATSTSHNESSPFVSDHDPTSSKSLQADHSPQSTGGQPTIPASDDGSTESPRLPMAEIGMINKKAQIQGTVTGITAGILFALVTRNVLRQSANVTMVAGLASGTSVGYFATRSNLHQGMRHLQEHHKIVEASKSDQASEREMQQLDMRAGEQQRHEGGVAGLYNYQDRSHSTRGDH